MDLISFFWYSCRHLIMWQLHTFIWMYVSIDYTYFVVYAWYSIMIFHVSWMEVFYFGFWKTTVVWQMPNIHSMDSIQFVYRMFTGLIGIALCCYSIGCHVTCVCFILLYFVWIHGELENITFHSSKLEISGEAIQYFFWIHYFSTVKMTKSFCSCAKSTKLSIVRNVSNVYVEIRFTIFIKDAISIIKIF